VAVYVASKTLHAAPLQQGLQSLPFDDTVIATSFERAVKRESIFGVPPGVASMICPILIQYDASIGDLLGLLYGLRDEIFLVSQTQ
jgi:hypothetical protein